MHCGKCGSDWEGSVSNGRRQKFCPVCGSPVSVERKRPVSFEEAIAAIIADYGIESLRDGSRMIGIFADIAPQL